MSESLGGELTRLGPGWWVQQCIGLVLTTALMAILGLALMTLTRMLVEGTTSPDGHLPTFIVWFIVCAVPVVGGVAGGIWRELADERVHVDVFGNELQIDRWSTADERERFVERVASDERARQSVGEGAAATEAQPAVAVEPSAQELRAAALRRREVEPGIPASARVADRWTGTLRLLHRTALACLYGWLPLSVVAVLAADLLPPGIGREWGLLPMLLLPLGWFLLEAHALLRHRWLRSTESRSDLAGVHVASAFVGVVVFAVLGFTGLVMRDEAPGLALISIPLVVLCGWIIKRELRHPIGSGARGVGEDSPPDLTPID